MKREKLLYMWSVVMLVVGSVFLYGCNFTAQNQSDGDAANGKIQVTASFYPLYFLAQEIGGDKADVVNIIPAGAEPHEYELTAQDIVRIENSDILILNGAGLEPWGESIENNLRSSNSKTKLMNVSNQLATQEIVEDETTVIDPHVWLSPKLILSIADDIEQAFAEVDPANIDYYKANAISLKDKLNALDMEYKVGLQNCEKKDFVTSHAAFGYLASTYGLNQVAIAGLSPEFEPSAQDLARVAQFAKEHNVQYIFFESLISPKLSQTVAKEIGAQTLVLNPMEGLTRQELSEGKSYLTEMIANLVNLKTALVCK